MEQAFLAGKYLDEGTELEYRHDLSVVYLSYLGNGAYALDPLDSLLHVLLVDGGDVHDSLGEIGSGNRLLVDADRGSGLLLDLLDSLAALSDDRTDKLGGNPELLDTGNERLVVGTGLADRLHHLAHYVHAAAARLLEGLLEDVV